LDWSILNETILCVVNPSFRIDEASAVSELIHLSLTYFFFADRKRCEINVQGAAHQHCQNMPMLKWTLLTKFGDTKILMILLSVVIIFHLAQPYHCSTPPFT
jgi:hypothetical protein